MFLQSKFLSITFTLICVFSCNQNKKATEEKVYTSPCGCVLSKEDMIMQCPVDAIGDSVTICKVGTNSVIGSNRPPMTWQQYVESEYFGGEGLLVDCKTGMPLFGQLRSPIISYKNKQLIVDERFGFDVYSPEKKEWLNLDLPLWRKRVSAINNQLHISPDSLVLQPPLMGKEAIAKAAEEYETEKKRTDHYMVTNTVNRLLACALCGDKASAEKLLHIENDFPGYYSSHADSKALLDERIGIYEAYQAYLDKGGKREYYDLSIFPYFKSKAGKKK